jgi:hypothetical protein
MDAPRWRNNHSIYGQGETESTPPPDEIFTEHSDGPVKQRNLVQKHAVYALGKVFTRTKLDSTALSGALNR